MIWSKFIQPRLISIACTSKPIRRQRDKVIPKADGTVLEIGFGSGHNLPFYNKNNVKKIWIFHESIKYALASISAGINERLGYEYGLQKFFLSKKNIMPKSSKIERPFEKARIFLNSHKIKKF